MKQNHGYREQASGCQRGGRIEIGGGTEWEMGVSRCQLLYIEWINNKVLLYTAQRTIFNVL